MIFLVLFPRSTWANFRQELSLDFIPLALAFKSVEQVVLQLGDLLVDLLKPLHFSFDFRPLLLGSTSHSLLSERGLWWHDLRLGLRRLAALQSPTVSWLRALVGVQSDLLRILTFFNWMDSLTEAFFVVRSHVFEKLPPMEVADCGVLCPDKVFQLLLKECLLVLDAQLFTELLAKFNCLAPLRDHTSQETSNVVLAGNHVLIALLCVIL